MISRRLLRVKVLQVLYAYYKNNERSLSKAEKELLFSIEKTYDLYHYLLLLIVDVAHVADQKIDAARNKLRPSKEDMNPNTRFIDNAVIQQLATNNQFQSYVQNNSISWDNDPELIRSMFEQLMESEFYQKYMESETNSYEDDKRFVVKFFSHLVACDDFLFSLLEEKSIYWNDDIEFILSMIIKTLKSFKETDGIHVSMPSLYKDAEDKDFVKRLFRKSVLSHDQTIEMIKKNTKNWDVERIAYVDVLIMEIALTEIREFTSIPVKVTFNEYLEVAKYYSTENSSNFINGILDKMVGEMRQEGKIEKSGRGLMGEN